MPPVHGRGKNRPLGRGFFPAPGRTAALTRTPGKGVSMAELEHLFLEVTQPLPLFLDFFLDDAIGIFILEFHFFGVAAAL